MRTTMRFPLMTLCAVAFLLALVLQLSLVDATQASILPAMMQQAENCQTAVIPGWQPYRIQAEDRLDTLATRTNVTRDRIMQVNCLTSAAIDAGALLLLPTLPKPSALPNTAQNHRTTATLLTSETAPAAAVHPLLTVISTTATVGAVESAASKTATTSGITNMALQLPTSLVMLTIFALGGLGIFFFVLRPRQDDSAVVRSLFGLLGNLVFLFAGVFLGVILFPMVRLPSFTALPTAVSGGFAVALIGLLVIKEICFSGQQWRTMSRLLNFGIVPLLMLFFLTVATRVAETIN